MRSIIPIPLYLGLLAGLLGIPGFAQDLTTRPEPFASTAGAIDDVSDTGADPVRMEGPDGTPLGWDYAPPVSESRAASDDEIPTELELLSRSSTGVGFDAAFYDAESDNPLTPVSVVLRALDKITARYSDIEIPLGETVRFGTLQIIPRICDKRPPEEFPETTAFIEIFDIPATQEGRATDLQKHGEAGEPLNRALPETDEHADKNSDTVHTADRGGYEKRVLAAADKARGPDAGKDAGKDTATGPEEPHDPDSDRHMPVFTGWMFASSVGLNPLDHAVYDVWVIDCNMVDPEQSAGSL